MRHASACDLGLRKSDSFLNNIHEEYIDICHYLNHFTALGAQLLDYDRREGCTRRDEPVQMPRHACGTLDVAPKSQLPAATLSPQPPGARAFRPRAGLMRSASSSSSRRSGRSPALRA